MGTRRRGLGDVLHYFISEEEQAAARQRAGSPAATERPPAATEPPPAEPAGPALAEDPPEPRERPAARWCVPASPARPLACSLATELAAALAHGGRSLILAPFVPAARPPRAAGVEWRALSGNSDALERELDSVAATVPVLIALPPHELPEYVARLGAERLDGLILPLDAGTGGASRALATLRGLAPRAHELVIGAVIVGADDAALATRAFERLAHAARRQLGVSIERLGEIPRDPARYRSLLRGVSLLELGEEGPASRGLRVLGSRLRAL